MRRHVNSTQPSRKNAAKGYEVTRNWRAGLPADWISQVVAPVYFVSHQEYEIQAERIFGYEFDEAPCFYEHRVAFTEMRSDDDEEAYWIVSYWEHLTAWRLIDERWLIHKQLGVGDESETRQAFFCFSDGMPK